jgi:hypothetical protein
MIRNWDGFEELSRVFSTLCPEIKLWIEGDENEIKNFIVRMDQSLRRVLMFYVHEIIFL